MHSFGPVHQAKLQIAQKKILACYPNIWGLYVFGSFGSKYENSESDLDLAILTNDPLDPVALWNLAQEIAIEIGQDVELIDLHKSSTIFRFQVISQGIRFLAPNLKECAKFEELCYSMYLRFRDAREIIMGDPNEK